ncbi:MAG: TrpR-related protein YerC/YecD [Clostridia bacterium]|nr:TrpR-related protein YerC/YecD [Clostridia bacterium]
MASKDREKRLQEMYELFASIDNPEDFKLFLDDLCTYKELDQMSGRIAAAKLFMEGHTYLKVIAETKISSATLSRVSRCVRFGEGYKKVLKPREDEKL